MSWLDAPLPAVLATYRKDGTVLMTPVWFRRNGVAYEVVVAEGDAKLRNLRRDPQCVLLVFEAIAPFRGIEVRGDAELVEGDVGAARADIAGRYLGPEAGLQFAVERTTPGVLVRLTAEPRAWDLSAILPAQA
jgi:PPOX class probable F420-dependent enzyme